MAKRVAEVDGVREVSPIRFVNGKIDGKSKSLVSIDPASAEEAFKLNMQGGDLGKLGKGLALDALTVKDNGYHLGDTFKLTLPTGSVTLPLVAIYKGIQGSFEGWVTSNAVVDRLDASPQDSQLYVLADKGADGAKLATSIQAAIQDDYPNLKVQDRSAYKQSIRDQVNQLLYLIYALLGLAVIIAILGIINTLALSVIERTREIGLLRAVGTTRKQLRRMIRLESW